MKTIRFFTMACLLGATALSCTSKPESTLEEIIELDNYPSASGVEYFDNILYIIGDDASQLLMLDKNLVIKDSMLLYASIDRRLPKETKPDNESIALFNKNNEAVLYVFGSGSSPHRELLRIINPARYDAKTSAIDTLYHRIAASGPREINIEGATHINGYFILSNRGHRAYPKNQLIFVNDTFPGNTLTTPFRITEINGSGNDTVFRGVSGLTYSPSDDRLLLSVSTEDTRSSYEDGAIGKSYIWIIDSISSKTSARVIQPDRIIDLEAIDRRFKSHKIESLCIIDETDKTYHLVLVSDNDNGSSTIFKMVIGKE